MVITSLSELFDWMFILTKLKFEHNKFRGDKITLKDETQLQITNSIILQFQESRWKGYGTTEDKDELPWHTGGGAEQGGNGPARGTIHS